MITRDLAIIAGVSYLLIFFLAVFANFFVLESLRSSPLETVATASTTVRWGIIAFLLAAVFDVIVAWALKEMYKEHALTDLSTWFRVIHAVIMGVGVFALLPVLGSGTAEEILAQVETFNTIWLIGLFFFGVHLVLLGQILKKPVVIALFLILAGLAYIGDTLANFTMADYANYADVFLAMVAIPSVLGEVAFTLWLLVRGGK
ncbi:DUF4386 domain-containing protein [Robertkochia sediminum]|uniref:DUF4386 domain-containing protein n=1 Tax=Robertkochia sediminum TaxID=2785326 RepID=UPI001931F867|nr:DUF4386 domain-containing protein [Robertkochia sediminum]MBL7473249.1 DUF4386 domain-containing protein [Robertkochia sediminum]